MHDFETDVYENEQKNQQIFAGFFIWFWCLIT